jgi:hypothetical protein
MKRALVAVLIGAAIFAGVYGFAATLGVNSDSLGAGSSAVAACQTGAVSVSYTSSYNAAAPAGYRATTVTVGNLDTTAGACGGKAIRVTLTGPGASNASLGEQTGTVPSSGSSMSLAFAGVNASDVTGVHVVIAG